MPKIRCVRPALVAGFLLAAIGLAYPHSWCPIECCHDRDCAPYDSKDVAESPEGFMLKSTGEFVRRDSVKFSPDEDFHLCRWPSGKIICFFIPNRGF